MFQVSIGMACLLAGEISSAPAVAERTDQSRLNSILASWEAQSQRGEVIEIEFARIIYDSVFHTEKRSTGRLILGDGEYRADLKPAQIDESARSQRAEYKLMSDHRSQTVAGNAERTLDIRHDSRSVNFYFWPEPRPHVAVAQKPRSPSWPGGIRFHIPLFLDLHVPTYLRIRAQDLKRRFRIEMENRQFNRTTLSLTPRGWPDTYEWTSLEVNWDHKKNRVHAVKIVDASGNLEIVYIVNQYKIDSTIDRKAVFDASFPGYSTQENDWRQH